MKDLLEFTSRISQLEFPILTFLLQAFLLLMIIVSIVLFIYDKFIQRENQLLINYPLIGRFRYIFYALRDPMRQYFGDEKFYESFDKVKWVYDAASSKKNFTSFSPGQPPKSARLSFKNANCVLNTESIQKEFSTTFGEDCKYPFKTKSVFGRSAMSDGAISPEGTRAFSKGAFLGNFPINTGEGALTSNFIYTHKFNDSDRKYMDVKEGTWFAKGVYYILKFLLNKASAQKVYRNIVIAQKDQESYLFDEHSMVCFRINWNSDIDNFPKNGLDDIPDIILQIGSGLYGVRDSEGNFDKERYEKVMKFSKMTEIKIAQGAKQTGGKLLASKVSHSVAYYRGVEPHKDLMSPNQFPYGKTVEELFEFVGQLKELSNKPVGIKIVISSKDNFREYARLIKQKIEQNSNAYPDFITIDGGQGGSGAAPLEMMITVGMVIAKALYAADTILKEYNVRPKVKLIASEKILTPDDAVVLFGLGANFLSMARSFMLSAGCIRARECSGAYGRDCPVGLATQNDKKRASFLVEQKSKHIASYHNQMVEGLRGLLAVIGINNLDKLNKSHIIFKDHTGKTYINVDKYFEEMLVE